MFGGFPSGVAFRSETLYFQVMEWREFEAVRQVLSLVFDFYTEAVRREDKDIQVTSRSIVGRRGVGSYGFEYRSFARPDAPGVVVLGATALFLENDDLDRIVLDIVWDHTGAVELRREILVGCNDPSPVAQLQRVIIESCAFLRGLRAEHVANLLIPLIDGASRRNTMRYGG